MLDNSLTSILLYPPLTDPTSPYHSLVYLASHARAQGFPHVEIRDTNIEALSYCARPDVLQAMTERWEGRRRSLAARASLSRLEQIEYLHLVRAQAVKPDSLSQAIATLRSPDSFYDYSAYRCAVRQIQLWLASLSCDGFPGQFTKGFGLSWNGLYSLSSVADLSDKSLLDNLVGPFLDYYRLEFFPSLCSRRYDVIGINVTYTSQLPYALWLAREIRSMLPRAYIVCGGTEISDVWKYLTCRHLFPRLFQGANACVIGEGETAFVRILKSLSAGQRPHAIPNVVCLDNGGEECGPPPSIEYEVMDSLPTPDYGLMRSDLYFSPDALVYYSPTRGCYWNRCTFCDYGLNFGTPTSPWRQRNIDRVLSDLKAISQYTPYVYLSVDVLAPGPLLKLAEAIVEEEIDIRWSAEIRLERFFTAERCKTLRQSGCVAISVGFESGSQRILDRIDKGTAPDDIENTIKSFSKADIAVQMMGFTGFPSETYEDAMESISYLLRNSRYWTVAALGDFLLTPGAIVAQRRGQFGLSDVRPLSGDDIIRFLLFTEINGPVKTTDQENAVQRAKKDLFEIEFDRPFAGGIDSAHSIFYYHRYGPKFPRGMLSANEAPFYEDAPMILNGTILPHEPYDLLSLFDVEQLEDAHRMARLHGLSLDSSQVQAELESDDGIAFPVDLENPYFLRSDGVLIPCSLEMLNVLKKANGMLSLGKILSLVHLANGSNETINRLLGLAITKLRMLIAHRTNHFGALNPSDSNA